jgi:hypothetical protein
MTDSMPKWSREIPAPRPALLDESAQADFLAVIDAPLPLYFTADYPHSLRKSLAHSLSGARAYHDTGLAYVRTYKTGTRDTPA